jgi:hypothetical protein
VKATAPPKPLFWDAEPPGEVGDNPLPSSSPSAIPCRAAYGLPVAKPEAEPPPTDTLLILLFPAVFISEVSVKSLGCGVAASGLTLL